MKKNRIRPLVALRAIRALIRDPDATSRVFDVIDALSGNHGQRLFDRFARTPGGRRLLEERPDLLAALSNRERLRGLPAGTLGRCYDEFLGREELSAEGLVQASMEGGRGPDPDLPEDRVFLGCRLRDMHDLWHVVTGYGRDLVGEAALLAFTFAQTRNPGIGFIVATAYLRARGEMSWVRGMIREGYRRGRRAAWLPEQPWEELLERPLDEVRERLRVGEPPVYREVRSPQAPPAPAPA